MPTPSIREVHEMLCAPGAPFEMEELEIRGTPTRVWKNAPPSLGAILESSRAHGDRTFLLYEDDRWSFARHHRTAAQLAHRLIDRFGVTPGDRVAIAMRNFPEWSVAFWAAAAAGAVVVPLNSWWNGNELSYGLDDSGSKVLFADAERFDEVLPHFGELDALETMVVARDARAAGGSGLPEPGIDFAEAVGDVDAKAELPEVGVQPEDDATIFYTSGTTGFPKGVLGTHRNICTNLVSLGFATVRGALRSGAEAQAPDGQPNVYLLSVPFFHATGCHSVLVANLAGGNEIVLMHRWDPGRALELIEREKVTTFGGVPAMVWQAIEHPDFATRDLSSLKSVAYGGAPAAPELVRRIEELFPGRVPSNGWGLTETSSVTTFNSGADYIAHPDSVGVPVAVCDVKAVDTGDKPVPLGEAGELWVRGPNVVKGYYHKPDETAATFTPDGWLRTGDVGKLDDEGFVYLVDRAKDLVIRGGENISSVEVEATLFEHPAVTDAAVIGLPHHSLGEEVGAVVHLEAGATVTEDELRAFVAQRLAGFKVPVRIWFRDEPLPRNPAGKILKRALKEEVVG